MPQLFFRAIVSASTHSAIASGEGQAYLQQSNFDPLSEPPLNQQWLFTDENQALGAHPHLILNRTSSYAIDVVGGVFADDKSLQTYPLTANANQQWQWTDDPSGNHLIQGYGEPFVVDIPNGDPAAKLQVFHPNGGANQQWNTPGLGFAKQRISVYKMSCFASAPKVLDVPNGSPHPGVVIQQFTNPGPLCFNQYWRLWPGDRSHVSLDLIEQVESGTQVLIQSVCNGLFLHPQPIAGGRAWVEQTADGGGDDMLWTLIGDNHAGWKIQSVAHPGLVLDIPYSSGDDHVDLQVYPDNGGENQRWTFN